MADWRSFEAFSAPGRNKSERLRFIISQEFLDTHFKVNRLTPIFQTSAHLFARLPEINLIGRVSGGQPAVHLTTLDDAYACFEGIQRPHDDEDNGDSVLVYVLRPLVTIERVVSMTCQAGPLVPPPDCVLTVLVRTNLGLQDAEGNIDGVVTRLEWVLADGKDKTLPKNAESRYKVAHWIVGGSRKDG